MIVEEGKRGQVQASGALAAWPERHRALGLESRGGQRCPCGMGLDRTHERMVAREPRPNLCTSP